MDLKLAKPEVKVMDYFVEEYRKLNIPKRHLIGDRVYVKNHGAEIPKVIREGLVNYSGGVIVGGLGYFNVWLSPKPLLGRRHKFLNLPVLNTYVDGKMFCISFSPECVVDSVLRGWSFDYFPHKSVFPTIMKNLKKGNYYYNFYSYFKKNKKK